MIHVIAKTPHCSTAALVQAAFRRSVSYDLVTHTSSTLVNKASIVVGVNVDHQVGDELFVWLNSGPKKLILFGNFPKVLHVLCGAKVVEWPVDASNWSRSLSAQKGDWAQSDGEIRYRDTAVSLGAARWSRPLERFDFTNEWNNMGYGAIRADGSIWALAEPLCLTDSVILADLFVGGENTLSYCAQFEVGPSSVLWFNRPVGPIDSFEWRIVENFLSDWEADTLPCCPVISEIPWGFDSAITMRLDCDEDISSACDLWKAYGKWGVPLSLAIHTSNLSDETHYAFLHEFCAAGGALLSHTATHAPNWGGSYEKARQEGYESCEKIEVATGIIVRYAVSPFHQSPLYALQGLCDSNYLGCIGGIIHNDPEFLLARGGELSGLPRGFVGHSQQTMLHGDCMLTKGDPLGIYKNAYDTAYETQALFGYLDHPFSARYQYGWDDERQRIEAHHELIEHIRKRARNPLFLDENQALDFLRERAAIRLDQEAESFICNDARETSGLNFGARYRGRSAQLITGKHLS